MYIQPVYTGNKQINEPTLCSALIDKMGWKYCKANGDQQSNGKKKKPKSENAIRNGNYKITDNYKQEPKNNIKALTRKIKRTTATLPIVLTSREAYKEGLDKCQTCGIQKEEYKQIMQNVKVIEILIDGIIEKEQTEWLDRENGSDEELRNQEKGESKNSTKIACKFDIYGGEIIVKHNLKCILIKLQKTIGDILVQIGFVKTRGLVKDVRYQGFDLSLDELKQLKFEFTSLTDKIIQLFKKPPDKKSNGDVCTLCVKEKLTKYNELLLEILKRGRNLKVVMRNEQLDTTDQCCRRSYPHVHAQVHGKPLVLKYSLPFEIHDHPAGGALTTDKRDDSADRCSDDELGIGPMISDRELDNGADFAVDGQENRRCGSIRSGSIASSQVEDEVEGIYGDEHKPLYMAKNNPSPPEVVYVKPSTQNVDSEKNYKHSDESFVNMHNSGRNSGKSEQGNESNEKDNEFSEKYKSDERSSPDQICLKIDPRIPITDDDYHSSDDSSSSIIIKRQPELIERNVSYTRSRGSRSSKKVSFYNEEAKTAFPLAVSSSKTGFTQLNNLDYSPNITIPENDSGMGKTPFGDKVTNVTSYPAAVDSFIITKERKISAKEEKKIVDFLEDKPIVGAYKSFVLPEYEIHNTLTCQSVKGKNNQSHSKVISHQDKKIEHLLKLLGKETLLSVTTPADCCEANNFLAEYGSSTNMPLSASLYSLPLDHSDMRYLAQVAGKHISNENLWLESDKEVPVKEYEWENQQPNSSPDQTKWQRAFAGTERQSELSVKSEETPQIKWTRVKSTSSREELKVLPTIDEEEPYFDKTVFNMPYVPSISSLPLTEEEKNALSSKRMKPRGKNHKTMELRYFTVEFENKTLNNTSKQIELESGGTSNDSNKQVDNKVDLNISKDCLKFKKKNQTSIESFHSCCSSPDILTTTEGNKHLAEDEMIMMNAIYLDSNTISMANSQQNSCFKPTTLLNSFSCSQNLQNKYSYTSVKSNNAEESNSNHRISQQYVHLWKDQMIQKRPHSINKNNRTENGFYMEFCKNAIKKSALTCQSNLKEQRCCEQVEKIYDESQTNNLNDKNKGIIRENFIQSMRSPAKTLQDNNTIIRNEMQSITGQGHQWANFPLHNVFTFAKNKQLSNYSKYLPTRGKNLSPPNGFEKSLLNKGNDYFKRDTNLPKISNSQRGYWSKLNIKNKNIKINTNHKKLQKSFARKHKELKRKPFIPKISCLNYRRMEGKANMPLLRFTQLRPVLARERIPSLLYNTKNTFLEMYRNFQDKANLVKTSFESIPKNSPKGVNIEKAVSQKLQFGFEKEYISVKKNHNQYEFRDLLFKTKQKPIAVLNCNIPNIISRTKLCNIGDSNHNSLVNKSSYTISTKLNQINGFPKQSPLQIAKISSQQSLVSNKLEMNDLVKETEKCNSFYLYDVDGLPLTDNSGRPLRNLNGDLLMVCNDAGIPISDTKDRPIYDALGHSLYSTEFTPKKPSCADILRSLTTSSGQPMLFYDVEGRPLTSISGTILVDSSGNCLIKFGSNGNPVSDKKGRPIFDIKGKPVTK